MKKFTLFFLLIVISACSRQSDFSEFDSKHYTVKIMYADLQYDFDKAKLIFDNGNLSDLKERQLWHEETMYDLSIAKNDQPFFTTCKAAYLQLNELIYLYDRALSFGWDVSEEVAAQERLVKQGITRCGSFASSS